MTPVPGPIVLLVLPLLVACIAYLIRRWAILAALLSSATAGVLAILCLRLPLDRSAFVLGQEVAFGRPVVILGRNLLLDPTSQGWLGFVFAMTAFLCLYAWRMSQGRAFFASSLVVVSLYALTAMLQTFSLALIVFAISTTLAVFAIQGGQGSTVRGVQRYLVVNLLALPLLLLAAWFVDRSALDPTNAEMARRALWPAVLGFWLLLAAFPFGTWMPAMAAEAPPIATALTFTTGQAMALLLVLRFLHGMPMAWGYPATTATIQLTGLVMAAAGGVMAAVQQDFGRLFGYAALSDLGYVVLALDMGGSQGVSLALLHGINRAIAITLLATALAIVRQRANSDEFAKLRGVARRLPIATAGMMLGGLALAGFPFTAGFPTHWAINRALWSWLLPLSPLSQDVAAAANAAPSQQWVWVLALLALLASSAGVITGLLRGLKAMLGTDPREEMARQPILASLMVLVVAILATVVGLCPQLFLEPVLTTAQALF